MEFSAKRIVAHIPDGCDLDAFTKRLKSLAPFESNEIDDVLACIGKSIRVRAKRDIVFERGCDNLHLLLSGWVCKGKIGHDGRCRASMLYLPGDILDLDRLYISSTDFQFTAFTDSVVASIDRRQLFDLIRSQPRIAYALAAVTTDENRRLCEKIGGCSARTARERLCHLICETAMRLKAIGYSDGSVMEWPLTQEQTAEFIGLTSVHLNRVLQEVRAEGLIEWKATTLKILDWQRLLLFADFDPQFLTQAEPDQALQQAMSNLPCPSKVSESSIDHDLSDVSRHEIGHRMKNLFAMVHSLVAQTLRDDTKTDLSQLRDQLLARIQTLGAAAQELVDNDWRAGSLASMVGKALSIHRGTGRIDCSGPDVTLSGHALMALALALHELQTNAMKHGSLSVEDGRVSLFWKVIDHSADRHLWMQWSEHDGPPAVPPEHKGFGTRILASATPRALSGEVCMDYTPQGLTWLLSAPLKNFLMEEESRSSKISAA